jgi:hypothetical protein
LRLRDLTDIGPREMRVHRQRELHARPALGRGTVIARVREGRCTRQRMLVVDAGLDAGLREVRRQRIPILDHDREQMMHIRTGLVRRVVHKAGRKRLVIPLGRLSALGVPALQMGELHRQNCGLNRIEAAVNADDDMVVAAVTTVIAHQPDAVRQPRIISDHRSGVAKRAEVLARVEAEAADTPDRAREPPIAPRPVRLRGILDHCQAVPVGEPHQLLHVGHAAIQVNGN